VLRPEAAGPWRRAGPGTCVVEVAVQRGDGQRRIARIQRAARRQQVRLQRRANSDLGSDLESDLGSDLGSNLGSARSTM